MDAAVGLVKAYLELQGYFVLAELPVREEERHGYRDVTDVDIIAVRFPRPPDAILERTTEAFVGTDPHLGTPESAVDVLIGEVKEGAAHLNPGLRRRRSIELALRRVGCCPEAMVEREAEAIGRRGRGAMEMPGALPCEVRVVAFAGRGGSAHGASLTVPLRHCAEAVIRRIREPGSMLAGARLHDPVLELLSLAEKLSLLKPSEVEVAT